MEFVGCLIQNMPVHLGIFVRKQTNKQTKRKLILKDKPWGNEMMKMSPIPIFLHDMIGCSEEEHLAFMSFGQEEHTWVLYLATFGSSDIIHGPPQDVYFVSSWLDSLCSSVLFLLSSLSLYTQNYFMYVYSREEGNFFRS